MNDATLFLYLGFLTLYAVIILRSGKLKSVLRFFKNGMSTDYEIHMEEQLKRIIDLQRQLDEQRKKEKLASDEYYSYNNAKKFFYD